MCVATGSARRAAVDFGELKQHSGLWTEDERTSTGVHSHEVNYSRRREQQACRDYWARVYGADAERASRGGVMWLD